MVVQSHILRKFITMIDVPSSNEDSGKHIAGSMHIDALAISV